MDLMHLQLISDQGFFRLYLISDQDRNMVVQMMTAGCKDGDVPGMKVTCHIVYMLPEQKKTVKGE